MVMRILCSRMHQTAKRKMYKVENNLSANRKGRKKKKGGIKDFNLVLWGNIMHWCFPPFKYIKTIFPATPTCVLYPTMAIIAFEVLTSLSDISFSSLHYNDPFLFSFWISYSDIPFPLTSIDAWRYNCKVATKSDRTIWRAT